MSDTETYKGGKGMPVKVLDPHNPGMEEDWEGNNAAFRCPCCGKVFIVSGTIHSGERKCPNCGKSIGRCDIKGRKSGGTASLEW
jgi:predicted RNA-binding Zn-ribbon protein involved in translation (DUF1610 family)